MNSVKLLEPFECRWADVLPVMLNENPLERPLNLTELPDRIAPVAQAKVPRSKRLAGKWMTLVFAVVVLVLGIGCWLYWGQSGETIRTDDLLAIPAAAPEG